MVGNAIVTMPADSVDIKVPLAVTVKIVQRCESLKCILLINLHRDSPQKLTGWHLYTLYFFGKNYFFHSDKKVKGPKFFWDLNIREIGLLTQAF